MSKKQAKFSNTPESADRKAMALADFYERGELSDTEYFRKLEALCFEGRRGPYLEATYASIYITLKSYDRFIIGFILEAVRKRPDHPALAFIMSRVAEEFGLEALCLHFGNLFLDQIKLATTQGEESAFIGIRDAAARDIAARGSSWNRDRNALMQLDYAVLESMLGHDEKANATVGAVLVDHPLWLPALRVRAKVAWNTFHPDVAREVWDLAAGCGESVEYRAGEALCRLISGQEAEAGAILEPLLARTSMLPDPTTLAELCIATGRGADGARAFYRFIDSAIGSGTASDYFVHLSAGMALLSGDAARALQLWKKIESEPIKSYATLNIRDLASPPENRQGPFLFRLVDLAPYAFRAVMQSVSMVQPWELDDGIDRALGVLRSRGPGLVKGIARLLIRFGDLESLHHCVRRLICPWFPELDSWLLAELDSSGLSPRRRAFLESELIEARLIIPKKGERERTRVLSWSISWEGKETKGRFGPTHEAGFACLASKDWKGAEARFRALVELDPDDTAGWNNLRVALQKLGKSDEVARLGSKMRERFPGYIHIQTEIAREFAGSGDSERSLRILEGLLARESFHGSEFRGVMQAMIDIRIARRDLDEAMLYFDIWESHEIAPEFLEPYLAIKAVADLTEGLRGYEERAKKRLERKKAREKKTGNMSPKDRPVSKDPDRSGKMKPPEQPELF